MRHPRGIDLVAPIKPARYEEHETGPSAYETLGSLREWEVLGARCGKCGRTTWLDKRALVLRYGDNYLRNLVSKLTCLCGNRDRNRLLIGRLGRG